MVNYYSQNGEDFLLDQLFKDQKHGIFVEVGCIDGRRFSNTLTFEERGWTGLCVEAHNGYIELLRKNRSNSIVSHCAVGEQDEDEVTFFANSRGSLSSLDGSQESHFREKYGDYFSGFEEQNVRKRKLDTLFQEHKLDKIDILSLDIEGYEVLALKGIDFTRYKPRVMLIESDSVEHEHQLDDILISHGYTKSIKLSSNIYYLLDAKLERKIINKNFQFVLTHTRHPLDKGEDEQKEIEIDTRSKNNVSKYIHKIRKKLNSVIRTIRNTITKNKS